MKWKLSDHRLAGSPVSKLDRPRTPGLFVSTGQQEPPPAWWSHGLPPVGNGDHRVSGGPRPRRFSPIAQSRSQPAQRHCQLVEGSALLPREVDAPDRFQQAHVTASHSTNARVRSRRW